LRKSNHYPESFFKIEKFQELIFQHSICSAVKLSTSWLVGYIGNFFPKSVTHILTLMTQNLFLHHRLQASFGLSTLYSVILKSPCACVRYCL